MWNIDFKGESCYAKFTKFHGSFFTESTKSNYLQLRNATVNSFINVTYVYKTPVLLSYSFSSS